MHHCFSRFMVDKNIVGCSWVELGKGTWQRRPHSDLRVTSRCQIEVDVSCEDLISHLPEGEWSKVAPFRILSFDIECAGRKGTFKLFSQNSCERQSTNIEMEGMI